MLVLPAQEAASVRVLVERVVFADGTLWRRLPEHQLTTLAESGWRRCACSRPNPPESARCLLCGRPLAPPRETPQEAPREVLPVWEPEPVRERPAPIVRDFTPAYPPELYEAAEERSAPRVLVVLLCIFGGAAVLAAAAFLTFCLLYTPCVAAVSAIRRELGGRWSAAVVVGQCVIAWVAALLVYGAGAWIAGL